MKKRLLAILLALSMVLAMLLTAALAAEEQEEFLIGDDGVLYEYDGPGGDIVIPDGVTQISFYGWGAYIGAFEGCKTLTGVTIPDSVTTIGISAFRDCTNLTRVTIPNNVTIIASGAFANCTSLTDVTIPSSVTRIEGGAFDNTP